MSDIDETTRQYLQDIGRKGGQQTSDAKREAARFSIAKARAAKDFYRRNPSEHPHNKRQQDH